MKDLGVSKALVLGLGKMTGAAVATSLIELEVEVCVSEIDPEPHRETARVLRELGVEVEFGQPSERFLKWADVVVPAPGVPPSNPFLKRAVSQDLKIWSEIELGARLSNGPMICITGTNGKTTTTTLVAAILNHGGTNAVACGNIGFPLVEAVRNSALGTTYVCEVSSFQLTYIESLSPQIAVILNIAEDHSDWHESVEGYVAAKGRITENQADHDLLVVRSQDTRSARIASSSRAAIGLFGLRSLETMQREFEQESGRRAAVVSGIEDGRLFVSIKEQKYSICDVADIRLEGPGNRENVVAATLVAAHVGIDDKKIQKAISDFEGLPHRCEPLGAVNGVKYVNDSKATNPHATLSALQGLNDVILIAGGRAKGVDLSPLAQVSSSLKSVLVMGEAAGALAGILGESMCVRVSDIEEAVRVASSVAAPGDTVLLSPACSSLDQYENYADRGNRFKEAVRLLGQRVC